LSTRLINTVIAVLFFAFAAYHVVKRVYLALEPPAKAKQAYLIVPVLLHQHDVSFSDSKSFLPCGQ